MVSVTLKPITEADVPAVVELIHWSKLSLTINRILWDDWPNSKAQKGMVSRAVTDTVVKPQIKALNAIDDATGEILGHIVFQARLPSKEAPKLEASDDTAAPADDRSGLAPELNQPVLNLVMNTVEELTKPMAAVDHIELTFIVVKQGYRGKGIGTKLVDAAFEHARSEGLPLYIGCEPDAVGFFEKKGMRENKHVDMDLVPYARPYTGFGLFRLTGLIWYPSSSG